MTKPTPGPWIFDPENQGREFSQGWGITGPTSGATLAHVPINGYEGSPELGTSEANARLIAAAPDLFESLRLLIKEIDRWEEAVVQIVPSFARSGKWESLEAARAAIAKAETP